MSAGGCVHAFLVTCGGGGGSLSVLQKYRWLCARAPRYVCVFECVGVPKCCVEGV